MFMVKICHCYYCNIYLYFVQFELYYEYCIILLNSIWYPYYYYNMMTQITVIMKTKKHHSQHILYLNEQHQYSPYHKCSANYFAVETQ